MIPTLGAIVPAAVGVDIGCGMTAQRTSLSARAAPGQPRAAALRDRAAVPHGGGREARVGAWDEPRRASPARGGRSRRATTGSSITIRRLRTSGPLHQLGTLGGGNHFIEICLDQEGRVSAMLHSGSRGPGTASDSLHPPRPRRDGARADRSARPQSRLPARGHRSSSTIISTRSAGPSATRT